MGIFSSQDEACDEDSEHDHDHVGPFDKHDETWRGYFHPKGHDDEYVYGHAEAHPYATCENCGKRVKYHTSFATEFEKIPKDEIPETDLKEIEVAMDRLRYVE